MNKFNVGDIVQLASGGPQLTVSKVYTDPANPDKERIHCQWFGGKKLEDGTFPAESLIKVATDKK